MMESNVSEEALQHFYRQNYYVARDLWEGALAQSNNPHQLAEYHNGLGATYDRIKGTEYSRPHFEQAVRLLQGSVLSDLGMKARTNLIYVLTRSGFTETALQVARETEALPYTGSAFRQALFQVSVLGAFSHAEVYEEILSRIRETEQLFSAVPASNIRNRHFAAMYQYAGYAAQMKGQWNLAVSYYHNALAVSPTPDVWRDLAKTYLLMGDSAEAVDCLKNLQPSIWHLTEVSERIELAYALELLAMFAWLDNQQELFTKFAEKAELYFGQESRWTEWLHMQNLGNVLDAKLRNGLKTEIQWEKWRDFLDELNVLDGLDTMFPAFRPNLRYASLLASHIYSEYNGTAKRQNLQLLEHATRLAYVGLTALAISYGGATELLSLLDKQEELITLSVKLLDSYPWAGEYTKILRTCRDYALMPKNQNEFMSVALGMALHYMELIEFNGLTHQNAFQQVLEDYQGSSEELLRAFVRLFTINYSGEICGAEGADSHSNES